MAHTLYKSEGDLNRSRELLKKDPPSYRQAYSDRTAWLMACLSELAYIKFNPPILTNKRKKFISENILTTLKRKKTAFLLKYIGSIDYDHDEELKKLQTEMQGLGMSIVSTFDGNGTQAILVSNDKFLVLAFRGTEKTSIKDIRTGAKAKIAQCETGGKIHMGFKEAYEAVALDIQEKINEDQFSDKPLFITGHSLGGALATIAAKKLSHKGGIAACYTFGSPRVGDDEWIAGMKTSVYRVVNAADCVTMMPPGKVTMDTLCWAIKRIPYVGEAARSWVSKLGGYLHCGDMRYLTDCWRGQYDDVKLLYYVSFFYRIKGFFIGKFRWNKFLRDHSISIYRKKLMVVAEKRNTTK